MAPHLHIASQLLQVQFGIVSRSDTESGVVFALSLTVQKLVNRRIRPCVPLRGHSIGGWASWSIPIYLLILAT